MSMWTRVANVFRRTQLDRDIDEELRSHLEEARIAGRNPAEAARAFGSPLRAREGVRDAVLATWLESMLADVVFGWRQLLKHKTASAAAVVSLALGIGSCTAAFRLIDALLLRPLPVSDPGRLYVLSYEFTDASGKNGVSDSFDYPGFRKLRAAAKDHAELMAISYAGRIGLTYGSDQEMERAYRQYVSGRTFTELGLKPSLGRLFDESDDLKPGGHPYAVISFEYWRRRFGRDPGVIGRTLRNANDVYQIVGVSPDGFTGTETGTLTDVFLSTMMNARAIGDQNWQWFRIWVHVKSGVSPELVYQVVRAAFQSHRQEQAKSFPPGAPKRLIESFLSQRALLEPAGAGISNLQRTYRQALAVLAVLVGLVLLISCANVANLMTAQAAMRAREMALRVSIGAGRARLIQLVLMESGLLAACASALGILFAWRAAPFVVRMINPPDDPARLILPADWRVTSFAVALTFAVTVLFGLAPALRASSVKPANTLKGGDDPHSRRRLMNALIAAQVAFCFLVHFVAGLFISTFDRLEHEPLGFSTARVLTLDSTAVPEQPADRWYQVLDRVRALESVESAAVSGFALMSNNAWDDLVWANGHSPEGMPAPSFLDISPGWFDAMRIPLIDGRDFRSDDSYPDVAVVNETFARRYFDGRSPVGSALETIDRNTRVRVTIVGYARDARYNDMRRPVPATIYVPLRRAGGARSARSNFAAFIVRTTNLDPLALASTLRREIPRARPEIRVANIRTQDELVQSQTIRERMLAMLSLFFAVVALVVAGVGLYGVLDYAVLERRRDLGIRIALGAHATHIATRVTVEAFSMLLIGAVAGLLLGIFSERYVATLLYQVKATDLSIVAAPAITILTAAVLAAFPPVLRAIRIDPVEMLRTE